MAYIDAYSREVININIELRKMNERSKLLREQRSKAMERLYKYMVDNDLESIGEDPNKITRKQCAPPKPRNKLKPKKQRDNDAIELCRITGIPDPETFFEEFKKTQKNNQNAQNEQNNQEIEMFSSTKKSRKKGR
jgi:Asp-tRNA(Asn)/Glu-tRNA(Gln) amidotransferase B subunit